MSGNAASRDGTRERGEAPIGTAETIVGAVEVYGWIGLAVAVVFLLIGVDRVDPSARGSYAFRTLIVPGVVVLWPLVLWRWWALERRRGAG